MAKDPLNPFALPIGLACKLGSVIVHADEATEKGGHDFDIVALRGLLDDPDVKEWLQAMRDRALLPVKRSEPPRKK